MESLEFRLLFSRAVDTSSVGLFNPDGTAAILDRTRDTWLVILVPHSGTYTNRARLFSAGGLKAFFHSLELPSLVRCNT